MRPTRNGRPARDSFESILIQLLGLLPQNLVSRGFGALSDVHIPEAQRKLVYGEFSRLVGVKTDESEFDFAEYPTLNAFFTRRLRSGIRPIASSSGALISPVDGRLTQRGRIHGGQLTQIKGRSYSLDDLLNDHHKAKKFDGGHFLTIYLSPKDYHRIHWPLPARVEGFRYEPGHLLPVFPMAVRQVDKLFCVNERVAVYGDGFATEDSEPGAGVPLAVVMVGATCVGRMTLAFDDLSTNGVDTQSREVIYDDGPLVAQGDDLGAFNLGSTVIILIGSDGVKFDPMREGDVTVKMGQQLGTVELGGLR